ncbi:MAG: hypothetical protein EOO90_05215 [Pedobacter sp.]|nr:MAG: hypothetical protein EOO90_05215 [Pedobacter sp.]
MKILDLYFRIPILLDYSVSITICALAYKLRSVNFLPLPKTEQIYSMSSDLTTIGLTLAGFILTFLTVLITFKADNKVRADNYDPDAPVFELFFGSHLYFLTIGHLKNATKSLVVITVIGYIVTLVASEASIGYLYYYNIIGITIITLTLWRCLLIVSNILKMQR